MKIIRNFIQCTLAIGCFTHAVHALEHESDIQIRIHAPFPDLYAGEVDYWLVRVENRGTQTIPVPNGGPNAKGEGHPPQFQVQTEDAVRTGEKPKASAWGEIQSFGNGMEALVDKSVLEPGQAMEAFSQGLAGQLRTPPHGGTFRVAMQVGPDEFVYSNWIVRTRHERTISDIRTIHVGNPWGNTLECQIQISEGTSPRYVWFAPNAPASRFAEPSLRRICEVPEGMVPEIQLDKEWGQYVISFPQGGADTVYFAHRCGLSKSTPWPKGYMSKDFLLTSYPVSAPSPIGFPLALFQENIQSMPNQGLKEINSADRPSKSNTLDAVSRVEEPADMDRPSLWIFAIPIFLLAGLIAFLISIRRNQK